MKTFFALLFLAVSALAQPVSVGLKAGVPFNRAQSVVQGLALDSQYWTVGPTLEVAFPWSLAVGVDALYRRFDASFNRNVGAAAFSQATETGHWEFPLYLKYRFGKVPFHPFVAAGGAASYARITNTASCAGDPLLCRSTGAYNVTLKSTRAGGGLLFGGGLEFRAGVVKIAPEVRYTRWFTGFLNHDSGNQAELLLGIRF